MPFGALVRSPAADASPAAGAPASAQASAQAPRLAWPLGALCAWALAWGLYALLASSPAPAWLAPCAASALGVVLAILASTRTRTLIVALGFPLSWLASGAAAGLPAWAWLLPLALLLLVYPLSAWRDAPIFPTAQGSLDGLAALAPLPPYARVLDAGCGLGHGLDELRLAYPRARLEGIEWSWPLAMAARLRCREARVRRGDMWAADWHGVDFVYLFQRPETLPRAVDKARRELAPGAWLASLEFEAEALEPQAMLQQPDLRPLWLYRAPFVTRRTEEPSASPAEAR